ncbi:ABC transporter substrate-binding protein [Pararhizobium gei]|uniref:ABC transporter substrate-binding protein n=1 Tax=Pararhizobium gei TaxID=1395951 RepID=UPI0023DB8584|nr:ABC transporter substrate-binding protein [Rhizobium gei]
MTKRSNDPAFGTISPNDMQLMTKMLGCGVGRRQFMSWLMAAGATAAASSTIFADVSQALAATPKKGDRLILASDQHGPNDTLNPALATSSLDYFRLRMFYGSLTRLTANLTYEPELAEQVTPNQDATEWTFKLRQGVEFHDGRTLTADDVIYSMNRHLGKDSISKASSLVSMVKEWKKVGKYEVKAILDAPNADLPIALGTFHFKIIQDGQTEFQTTNGTGPYKIKEFKPVVRAIGVRHENYWTEGAYLDELETFAIGDPVARLNAFLAGDVDIIGPLSPRAIDQVNATAGKEVWSVKSSMTVHIASQLNVQPSGNMDLIRAMQYLMDRERLVKGVFNGEGTIGNDQPIGPSYQDYCSDIPQRQLDPEKARYHFKKSGIGSTIVPIVTAEVASGAVEQCLFLQREAAKIGLNIDVQKVNADGYWGAVWLKSPICVGSWNMRPTANIMMTLAYESGAAWNETHWKDEKFDQLLVQARGITDPSARKQAYCDLQTMIHEGAGLILPGFRNYTDGAAAYVKGRTYVPLNTFGGGESAPTLWRDDA